jgi:hypothetical protein
VAVQRQRQQRGSSAVALDSAMTAAAAAWLQHIGSGCGGGSSTVAAGSKVAALAVQQLGNSGGSLVAVAEAALPPPRTAVMATKIPALTVMVEAQTTINN